MPLHVLSSRVIIHPVDLERSRRFYEEVIGLNVYREWGVGVALFIGGGLLELSGRGTAGATTLWLQVPSLDGVEAELAAVGVSVRKPTEVMPWGLVELWVEDPDGNELRLVEVPPDHPLRRR
ncbi:MAG: VOC family protein [Acidimicrobiia bacterium]|nr:VOC family protein [Acidimicrobiia bacterium]